MKERKRNGRKRNCRLKLWLQRENKMNSKQSVRERSKRQNQLRTRQLTTQIKQISFGTKWMDGLQCLTQLRTAALIRMQQGLSWKRIYSLRVSRKIKVALMLPLLTLTVMQAVPSISSNCLTVSKASEACNRPRANNSLRVNLRVLKSQPSKRFLINLLKLLLSSPPSNKHPSLLLPLKLCNLLKIKEN